MKKVLVNRKHSVSMGFTLIELLIAIVMTLFTVSAIGTIIIDTQRGWTRLYDITYSNVSTDGYVAKKKFDSIIRKASSSGISLDSNGSWVEVNYYASSSSSVPDRYARFSFANDDLNVEYGQLNPKVTLSVETVCANVSQCSFSKSGGSVQMKLKLDNGTQTNTVLSSASAQNL